MLDLGKTLYRVSCDQIDNQRQPSLLTGLGVHDANAAYFEFPVNLRWCTCDQALCIGR